METILFVRNFELKPSSADVDVSTLIIEKIAIPVLKRQRIALKHGDVVLERIVVSQNKPQVRVTYPNGGESPERKTDDHLDCK